MANLEDIAASWEAGVYQIETTDPVIGGVPNPSTGAGMSNVPHLQLARRTQWLKGQVEALVAARGNSAGAVALLATTTLTQADTGKRFDFGGTASFAVTLPSFSGLPDGAQFVFHSDALAPITINSTGSVPFSVAGYSVTSVVVGPGEFLVVTKGAGSFWRTYGSAVLKHEAQFAGSLVTTGWQRLPSGLIFQWGIATLSPFGNFNQEVIGGITWRTNFYQITYPVAFTTTTFAVNATLAAPPFNLQSSTAGRSASANLGGSGLPLSRFDLAITAPTIGWTPTIHWKVLGL